MYFAHLRKASKFSMIIRAKYWKFWDVEWEELEIMGSAGKNWGRE